MEREKYCSMKNIEKSEEEVLVNEMKYILQHNTSKFILAVD